MGNFDSKLTPYYAIIDENQNTSADGTPNFRTIDEIFNLNNNSLASTIWTVKKANFNENKNSVLYEFNYSKFASTNDKKPSPKHLSLALNQIRVNLFICRIAFEQHFKKKGE